MGRWVPTLILSLVGILPGLQGSTFAGGAVRTVDGKIYEGELRFDQDKVQVTPKRGQPTKLDVNELLHVAFRSGDAPRAPTLPPAGAGQLPGGWRPVDIGVVGTPGDVRYYGGVFAVKGAGNNVGDRADSFYFVSHDLNGDGVITCRVTELQRGDSKAKVGIVMRASTEPNARNMCLFVTPELGAAASWRTETGNDTNKGLYNRDTAPVWLRLVRRQNVITAYRSMDGRNWVQVEQREIDLESRAFVGLAVCSHDRAGTLAATFDNVDIRNGEPHDDERRNPPSGGGAATPGRAIIFRRGTLLANVQLISVNDQSVEIQRPDGKRMTVPAVDVAQIILAPLLPQTLAKIPDRGTGVLLARGDFMEGEVKGFGDGRVKLSSVLFGLSNFAAGSEVAVIVLNDPQPPRSTWVVRGTDGSVYYASQIKIDHDQLLITDDSAGEIKVSMWNLLEIKAGEARSDPLAELKPVKIDAGEVDAEKTFLAGPVSVLRMGLDGVVATSAVAERAGTSISYDLQGKYKVFLATVGVPTGTLPTVSIRYSVRVDGVEAYRSPARTSLDDPTVVSVNLAGAKSLTLHVDPAPGALPALVLWADAAMVK